MNCREFLDKLMILDNKTFLGASQNFSQRLLDEVEGKLVQFPPKTVVANFPRSYLPHFSSDSRNLGLHGYLIEKSFLRVGRLCRSDTQFESYDRSKLPLLRKSGNNCAICKPLCWDAMGCGTHVGRLRHACT